MKYARRWPHEPAVGADGNEYYPRLSNGTLMGGAVPNYGEGELVLFTPSEFAAITGLSCADALAVMDWQPDPRYTALGTPLLEATCALKLARQIKPKVDAGCFDVAAHISSERSARLLCGMEHDELFASV